MPSNKRLVGLRLDEATYARLERMARDDSRSVAAMAEVLIKQALKTALKKKSKVAQ